DLQPSRRPWGATSAQTRRPSRISALLDPTGELGARVDPELVEHVGDVRLDRAVRDEQSDRNLAVSEPLGDQPSDLQLAPAEDWRGRGGGPSQLRFRPAEDVLARLARAHRQSLSLGPATLRPAPPPPSPT